MKAPLWWNIRFKNQDGALILGIYVDGLLLNKDSDKMEDPLLEMEKEFQVKIQRNGNKFIRRIFNLQAKSNY